MTFCKLLAENKKDNISVSAWENTEKFSSVPSYEIYVSKDSIAFITAKAAKTTWKKKFNEYCAQYLR